MPADYKNILVIKPSALGDIVLALPALSALRRSFPQARISWLVRPEFAPLLEDHPHLTQTILFDRRLLGKAWYQPRAMRGLVALVRQLRHSRFDAVVDLQGLFRTACLAWLTGCPRRFGMANAREGASLFYTHKVPQTPECIHLVDYYLKVVKEMGASDLRVEFVLGSGAASGAAVKRLLAQQGVGPDGYVVLVPASSDPDKCWPAERFATIADMISTEMGLAVVACGTAAEGRAIEEVQRFARTAVVNLAGRTSVPELVAVLRGARLVVSNDTGPGHMAAALGVPLVMLFSWSNPARIAPYRRPQCMVAREPFGRGGRIRSHNPEHLVRTITVEEVCEKVREQLSP